MSELPDNAMMEDSNDAMIQRNNEAVTEGDNDARIEHSDKTTIERNDEARTSKKVPTIYRRAYLKKVVIKDKLNYMPLYAKY